MNISTTFHNIEIHAENGVEEETPFSFSLSNTAINKAGNVIRCYMLESKENKNSITNTSQEDFINALLILRSYREYHLPYLKLMENLLTHKLNRLNILEKSIIASRSKRLESISSKLLRRPTMRLSQMDDMVGLRVTFANMHDLQCFIDDTMHCEIQNHQRIDNKIRENNYINSPKEDGYRGIHRVFKYQTDDNRIIRVELQLRTKIQHEWATIVEILGSLKQTSFKTGEGEDTHRQFLELSSVLFAIEEELPVIANYSSLTPTEICTKLREMDKELQIIQTLESVKSIPLDSDDKQDKYYLLLLNLDSRTTTVIAYNDELTANEAYGRLERDYKETHQFNVALVSVTDINKIKDAYPNYFLHTENFISRFRWLLQKYS